jgi:DNA-binding CsgD family transcriptional regulator
VVADEPPVGEMLEIAASTVPLLERARGLVETLNRWLPVDAIWLTLCDPGSHVYATVGSAGLEQSVLDYLDRPSAALEIQQAGCDRKRPPVSVTELPVPVEELPTWADCLIPSGFRDGLGVPILEPGGGYLGLLSLLFASSDPPSRLVREQIADLAPVIARGVSPLRSLLATARLVQGAVCGVVLLRDGGCFPLPGLEDHALLAEGSTVTAIARHTLLSGQVYRSFMWPTDAGADAGDHVRLTVLAATDVPPFVLGTLLLTPRAECQGLTARELVVLGLMVAGRSNQQISTRLAITPRTVATHVEHILHKLEVLTRTQAAVHAERDGCYVPAVRQAHRGR